MLDGCESSSEDYEVSDILLSYTDNYDRSDSIVEDGLNEDGYYHFTMPSTADEVTLTVSEKSRVAFASAPFVGDYLGFELWNNGNGTDKVDTLTTEWAFSLDGSGEFEYRNSTYQIADYDAETGIVTGGGYEDFSFVYSDKVVFSHYTLRKIGGSDCVFMVQKQEGDSDDLYSVKANFILDRHMLVHFFRDGQDYASAYYDVDEDIYYFDVDFSFVGATSVLDYEDGDEIIVSHDGERIVRLIADDGSFFAPDSVMGAYTLESDPTQVLALDGKGHVTYLGKESLSYTIVDATKCYITLDYNGYNYFGGEECGAENVENQTYEINEAEGTVTIHTFSQSGETATFDLSYNEDKTVLTFVGDTNIYYPTTGAELTLKLATSSSPSARGLPPGLLI